MSVEIARTGRGACVSAHASGVVAFGPVLAQRAALAPTPTSSRDQLDCAALKKVLNVTARELRGVADESGRLGLGLAPRSQPVRPGEVVGFLEVVGGAWAASPARDCSKELDRSRAGCWVLGQFRQRGIGRCVDPRKVEKSGTVWRGLAALSPSSCRDKLDGTPLKNLKVWHSRQVGIGGRGASGHRACDEVRA